MRNITLYGLTVLFFCQFAANAKNIELIKPFPLYQYSSTNKLVSIKDVTANLNAIAAGNAGFCDTEIKNYIRFSYDRASHSVLTTSSALQTYEVDIEITSFNYVSGGGQPSAEPPITITLTIKYDPANSVIYNDIEEYWFTGSLRVSAEITAIRLNGGSWTPSPAFMLEAGIQIERYYDFNPNWKPQNLQISYIPTSEELSISGFTIHGANAYDIEWTFANNYSDINLASSLSAQNVEWWFHNNCTRIRVYDDMPVTIPAVFDRGYVIVRVRGIGRPANAYNCSMEELGAWTLEDHYDLGVDDPLTFAAAALTAPFNDFILLHLTPEAHEASKNWTYEVNFAEGGKMKQVVSYYDGTQRNRQTVTLANTEKEVGEP
jgi:hypothetical protein